MRKNHAFLGSIFIPVSRPAAAGLAAAAHSHCRPAKTEAAKPREFQSYPGIEAYE